MRLRDKLAECSRDSAVGTEIFLVEGDGAKALVETLMGRRPELRFDYIQKNARFARGLDV